MPSPNPSATTGGVAIIYQYATQAKVADFIVEDLEGHGIPLNRFGVNEFSDIKLLAADSTLMGHDIVLSTLGGRETVALAQVLRENQVDGSRPLLASMNVGVILNHVYYGTFFFREGADIVFVNRTSDVERVHDFYADLGGTPPLIEAVRCPIFDEVAEVAAAPAGPPKRVVYSVQTDIPRTRPERLYVAQRLVDYALRHPDREVILKPKVTPGENTAHPQKFAFEDLLESIDDVPSNLVVSYRPMRELIEACDLLVTFSSTAVLEALALGKRGAVLIDFGAREILGNTYFTGSGLFASFDDLIEDRVPVVNQAWLRDELSAPTLSSIFSDVLARARTARDARAGERVSSVFQRCSQVVAMVDAAAPARKTVAPANPSPPSITAAAVGPLWAQADRIWRERGERLLYEDRLDRFTTVYADQRRKPVRPTVSGRPKLLLVGNGPGSRKPNLEKYDLVEKMCANWYIIKPEFDDLKPEHLLLGSRVISGLNTLEPRFHKSFISTLRQKAHRPVLWAPFNARELIQSQDLHNEFEINYLLHEQPFARSIDLTGAATLDASGYLDHAHSILLTLGVPAALAMGFELLGLAGANAAFTNEPGVRNYAYGGKRAEMSAKQLDAAMALWAPQGRAHAAFKITARQLQGRGVRLVDTTWQGALKDVDYMSMKRFVDFDASSDVKREAIPKTRSAAVARA